jgi:hypothetical protein
LPFFKIDKTEKARRAFAAEAVRHPDENLAWLAT